MSARHIIEDRRELTVGGLGLDAILDVPPGARGIVLGPGDLAVAHKPDEFVPLAELEAAAGIYRSLALDMLGRP